MTRLPRIKGKTSSGRLNASDSQSTGLAVAMYSSSIQMEELQQFLFTRVKPWVPVCSVQSSAMWK